jgi:hypothetical protein
MLLKGFSSVYWTETQKLFNESTHFCPNWELTEIWKDRNRVIQGTTWQESKTLLKERVIQQVTNVYSNSLFAHQNASHLTLRQAFNNA